MGFFDAAEEKKYNTIHFGSQISSCGLTSSTICFQELNGTELKDAIMRNIAQHEIAGNRSNVDIQLNRHATPGLPGLGFPIHAFDAD
ncbi:hypothetical protein PABG_12364 [Paracoccidioides brasiliensis Pb03]|nr:hypothetical protein PABG_12364 [Paracoccidioides brasiliensis Pb03]